MSKNEMIITVLIVALTTALTRFLPFILFPSNEKRPKVIGYLGKVLPGAVLALLVVYSFKDIFTYDMGKLISSSLASIVTIVSYLLKREMMISIILGTLVYMFMVQLIF